MSNIKKHFLVRFPIIQYEALYAELNDGTKTKTFKFEDNIHTQIVDLSEYLAALAYAIIEDALKENSREGFN